MMSKLYECTICKRNNLIIPKKGIFGVFTIINQIHLEIPLLREVTLKKRKLILESPNLLLLEKNKIFNFESQRTSYGYSKVWSKIDKFALSGIATQN